MRCSFVSAAVLAFASVVCAQTAGFDPITSPFQDQNVPAGQPFKIVWEPSKNYTGPITIQLLEGATPSTLSKGDIIKAGVDSSLGAFTWDVPTTLGSFATYGFVITLDSDSSIFQYSFPFHITGLTSNGAASSSSASASSTSTVTKALGTGTAYTSSSSSTAVVNSTSTAASTSVSSPASNLTLSTTIATKTSTPSKTAATTTSSAAATSSTNAAVAQVATGSLAMIGGLILAFAL